MFDPHRTRIAGMPSRGMMKFLFSLAFLVTGLYHATAQEPAKTFADTVSFDTIVVKKGTWLHFEGKTYKMKKDTVFVITTYENPRIENKSQVRSSSFYDSVYQKLSRKKFARLLYTLAFVPPENPPLPGEVSHLKSEVPFEKYKGKVIRKIRVITLSPFGTSIYDTLSEAITGVGKALNSAHINTKSFVIRKNLFFKEGQTVDPFVLADNERNIREMSFIDNVKTYVSMPDSTSDSLDIIIVAKDFWSVGFDIVTASFNRARFRIYDGNFLGLADRLTTNYSFSTVRSPFFRVDGISYAYNNISGTFLNTLLGYSVDDVGNYNLGVAVNRNFYSINTKWAFGAGYQYNKMVVLKNGLPTSEVPGIDSYYNDYSAWVGRSFKIKPAKIPSRFVIAESFAKRFFYSRPMISPDSNRAYYNTIQLITGLSYSATSSYLTDYILRFGKTENLPYGRNISLTLGPDINDFYTRLYGGIQLSAGDFLDGIGFVSGSGTLSGYFYHGSAEDCVIKFSLTYLTPLFVTPDKKFRVRGYLLSDYRNGFNFRKNNKDYTDINRDFMINEVRSDTVFHGITSLSATLAVVLYTPLYFYGFRFAFMVQGKGGYVAPLGHSLFDRSFYTGVGLGILIRNDNLISPSVVLSLNYYPSVPAGVPWWQFRFDQSVGLTLPDYNVTVPHVENLEN